MRQKDPILDSIGNTPLVELRNLSPKPGVRMYAKLEGMNPSGSIKDRIAKYMIEDAEDRGFLKPGMTIVEASTGNTGIALSLVGRRKGYEVVVVVPGNAIPEIKELLQAHGAKVIWGPPDQGTSGARRLAQTLASQNDWYMLDQFGNPANIKAHYETTGVEILQDLPDVDVFVAGLGTGGTVTGVGRRLKEHNPEVKVVAVEPHQGSLIQGIKSLDDGFIPPILDLTVLDAKYLVYAKEAFEWTREIAHQEGIFTGLSSGAVLKGAMRWAQEHMDQGNIVVLFADSGWKYLSTGVWSAPKEEAWEDLDDILWW
ncbi:MAG: cysK [Dehalococcoidia bacterium]|nr:cysK [Dehalococcoidia bacterium]